MHRARPITLLCCSLLVLLGLSLPAQARREPGALAATVHGSRQGDAELVGRMQRASAGTLRLARHSHTGLVRFVGTPAGQPIAAPKQLAAQASAEQVARAFLGTYGALFGASSRAADLTLLSSRAAEGGRGVVRFQQRFKGVPILGAELLIHTGPGNAVSSASGELLPEPDVGVQPRVSAATAQQRAIAATARSSGARAASLTAAAPELWIFDQRILGGPGLHRPALVWRTEVTSAVDPALRELVLVDAQLGSVALAFSQVHSVLNRFVCNRGGVPDTNATPNDDCDGTPAGEYSRVEGGPASSVGDVNLAYDYSGDTYNFFFTRFGRDSLDGAGLPLRSIVRYCPSPRPNSCPFANAFWNGQVMVYGAGWAAADDVVGHELSHGVTDFTSELYYYYQSGAINESLSDVFGELVDLTNGRGTDTPAVRWLLGEDLPASIGAIRDMKNPPAFANPDRMSGPDYYGGEGDEGGVHINSGVNNKAAFLLTDGGSFNGQTVQALGVDKVARLYYDVETGLLTSASDYQDLASALQQACQNLIGAGVMTAADCVQVTAAINATEMTIEPPAAQAPEAPVCSAGLVDTAFWSDDLENPASGRWTTQALLGTSAWYYPPEPNPFAFLAAYATSGKLNFWGVDQFTRSDSAIAMTAPVALPAGALMRFNHAYAFEDGDDATEMYDGGVVEYSIDNGTSWVDAGSLFTDNGYAGTIYPPYDNPLAGRQAFVRESKGYYSSRLDLQSLAGQSVRFRFRLGTDTGESDTGWFIDDIRLYTCAAAPTPVPPAPVPSQQRTFVPQVAR